MALKIKQGDSYPLPVIVKIDDEAVNVADVNAAEFVINGIRKLYPSEVTYSSTEGAFLVPLSQEETFGFPVGVIEFDVRVKFSGGNVEGIERKAYINIIDASSEEVL